MLPILFPHTYLTAEAFRALFDCFHPVTVYQPTRRLIPDLLNTLREGGQIKIRVPAEEVETEILSSLKAYRALGNMHMDRKGEMLHFQPSNPPFVDDTSPHKLRADISRKIQSDGEDSERSPQAKARLIHAGLFLQIAQEFDGHQDEIRQGMAAFADMEKTLFRNLKEEEDPLFADVVAENPPATDAPGERMLTERLSAWTRLFFHDLSRCQAGTAFPSSPVLLLTTSEGLFTELIAQRVDDREVLSITANEARLPSVATMLTELSEVTRLSDVRSITGRFRADTATALRIAVAVNDSPATFLSKHTGISVGDGPAHPLDNLQPNTLIGLISV